MKRALSTHSDQCHHRLETRTHLDLNLTTARLRELARSRWFFSFCINVVGFMFDATFRPSGEWLNLDTFMNTIPFYPCNHDSIQCAIANFFTLRANQNEKGTNNWQWGFCTSSIKADLQTIVVWRVGVRKRMMCSHVFLSPNVCEHCSGVHGILQRRKKSGTNNF